jgi:hypothetical protein
MSSWTRNHNTQGLNKCHNNMMHNIPILFNISPSIPIIIMPSNSQGNHLSYKVTFAVTQTFMQITFCIYLNWPLGQVSYCHHWASVVRRPSSVNFSHLNQLLWSHWANLNQTLLEWSLDGPLPKCVRWSRLPTKMAAKLKIEKRGMKF